jgi:pimeloyl-ACP methyl ester carboxylesterase
MVAEPTTYDRAVTGAPFALALPDGRRLEGWASDSMAPAAVLMHVGTPSAGVPWAPWVAAADDRGLRFVTYSRPGYAGSARQPGRSVADCAGDVTAIADALALDRLHVIGWSGGGPHALACAALQPELVVSAATIAGVAPFPSDGLDWFAGMAEENVQEFGAALEGPTSLERFLREAAAALDPRPETIAAALGGLVTDVDRHALDGPLADLLAALMAAALSTGVWGWHDDDLAFTRDWGFSVEEIVVPVTVWQGRQDAMVPFAHGEWLGRHVPDATSMLFDREGHLSLVLRLDDIVDDLVSRAST